MIFANHPSADEIETALDAAFAAVVLPRKRIKIDHRLTAEKEALAHRLAASGIVMKEIAWRVGVSVSTLYRHKIKGTRAK
jgi:DNA invertase Pin-like site-specific DNA recombinase